MHLSPALDGYDHVLLDLDGCVWVGDEPTPRAVEAVLALRAAGRGLAFVTNDGRHAEEDVVRKLWRRIKHRPYGRLSCQAFFPQALKVSM